MAANPYLRSWSHYSNPHNVLPLKEDGGIPVYVTKEGKVLARGFVDTNDDLEFYVENLNIKANFREDQKTKRCLTLDSSTNYKYSNQMYDMLTESFQYYTNATHLYEAATDYKAYKQLSKRTKLDINQALNSDSVLPTSFHFHTTDADNKVNVRPHIESSWFGPFNHDVYISSVELAKNIQDIVLVKSGQYRRMRPTVTAYNLGGFEFSVGATGHLYFHTPSVPEYDVQTMSIAPKTFKTLRTGNYNQGPALSKFNMPHSGIGVGPIGMMKNGVFFHSPKSNWSIGGSGEWNFNLVESKADEFDLCGGTISTELGSPQINVYHYKTAPVCLDDVHPTGVPIEHSPLVGYALDGFPVYGPYGYSNPSDSNSQVTGMTSSYRLKSVGLRPSGGHVGPLFVDYPSGNFIEDYEYIQGLGYLDQYNGRSGVTPEFPNGMYAYYTTMDDSFSPAYPYILGTGFYGNIHSNLGESYTVAEPIYQRVPFLTEKERFEQYPPDIALWKIYSDTHWINDGILTEDILWVSPHVTKASSGVFLGTGYEQYLTQTGVWDYNLNTGSGMATYHGNRRMATGDGDFLIFQKQFEYPTSMECHLAEAQAFSGGMQFIYTDLDTNTLVNAMSPAKVTGTEFYEQYGNHKGVSGKVHDVEWNGKIPAGTPFKIETWSFNGWEAGFDGQLKFWPCVPHPLTSGNNLIFSADVEGEGATKDLAYKDSLIKAKKLLKKRWHTLMVKSGIMNENANMKSWRKLKAKLGVSADSTQGEGEQNTI